MSGGASRLADTVYEAMQVRGDVMHKHRHALAQTAIDNFTHPVVLYNFKHKTLTQACTLHYIGALRVGAKWYTNVGLTSLPTHFHAKFNSRQYITEFIRSEDGKLGDALRMKVAVRPVRNEAREKRNDTTTILITGRRDVNPSFLGELPPYENPAIIASYARGEFYILQAADALTPSSIAILFLPLLLNLVPVSLIAHVKRSAMLGYILISDVLTCIPLLIKGAELISISTLRHRSVVTRLSASVNSSVSRSAVAESFGAECAAKEGFRSVGVVFVVIAMIVMVGGIAAEFFARRYAVDVRRRTFCKTGLEMGIGANHVGLFGVEYDK